MTALSLDVDGATVLVQTPDSMGALLPEERDLLGELARNVRHCETCTDPASCCIAHGKHAPLIHRNCILR